MTDTRPVHQFDTIEQLREWLQSSECWLKKEIVDKPMEFAVVDPIATDNAAILDPAATQDVKNAGPLKVNGDILREAFGEYAKVGLRPPTMFRGWRSKPFTTFEECQQFEALFGPTPKVTKVYVAGLRDERGSPLRFAESTAPPNGPYWNGRLSKEAEMEAKRLFEVAHDDDGSFYILDDKTALAKWGSTKDKIPSSWPVESGIMGAPQDDRRGRMRRRQPKRKKGTKV